MKKMAKKVGSRVPGLKKLVQQNRDLQISIGILQLEKGKLQAKINELQDYIVNPPGPHPPTNPLNYIPKTVKKEGQEYREFLSQQIYGKTYPQITGLAKKGKFLQIGLGRQGDGKFGPDWTAVDLYDKSPAVDFNYDVQNLPKAWTNTYDLALCDAIFEHIPYPQKAADELYRVLKPGGFVYCELPFWQKYHTGGDTVDGSAYEFGGDFWRATTDGLRVWMHEFEEISCGWANEGVVYFFGKKPKNRKT